MPGDSPDDSGWRSFEAGSARDGLSNPSALSVRTTCRIAALLYLGCGALVLLASAIVWYGPGASRPGIAAVGAAAMVAGSVIWFLPWNRWHPRASLALVPLAFTLIALHNWYAANDGFVYALFFMVAFVWIGLAHSPGTSLLSSPLLLAAYLIPLLVAAKTSDGGLWGAFYAVPGCVIVGEAVAWVADLLRRSEAAHRRRESHFRALFAANPQAMWVYDRNTLRFLEVNDAAVQRYGYSRDEFLAMTLSDIRPAEDRAAFLDSVRHGRPSLEGSGPWRHVFRDGTVIYVEVTSRVMTFDGLPAAMVSVYDVTARTALEEQLREQATHDPLTGLANRNLFFGRIDAALAAQPDGVDVAVLLLDLDGFKTVNDSLGHSTGDQVLVAVADRLSACLRPGDTAARLGGDEFGILLPTSASLRTARAVAARMLKTFEQPVHVSGMEFVVQASVGIATPAIGAGTAEELLRNADSAMYAAKAAGRGRCAVFEKSMYAAARERLELDAEMRSALAEHEFVLHFQPEVDLAERAVTGFEALIRWQHPRRGLVAPGEFIKRAEETGLIVPIGDLVLDLACTQLADWAGAGHRDPFVAVNLSAHQLVRPGLYAKVRSALERSGADPRRLVLEVTESAILTDTDLARRHLEMVRQLGVRVALDDFGTGYSSLTHLRALPIDVVKIDRSFVADLVPRPGSIDRQGPSRPLVEAIFHLTESLGITTVAEGVETEEQLRVLSELGCHVA
ncbi:MAG TPA: EAL domain-containing protein, partial [Acidimicrobiales bacterium]|nr:EAL domain-containing protein [Acidimicrobiales bacterium]